MSILLWIAIGTVVMFLTEWMVMEVNEDEDFKFTMWNRIGGIILWPIIVFWVVVGFLQGFLGK